MNALICLTFLLGVVSAKFFHRFRLRVPPLSRHDTQDVQSRIINGQLAEAGQFPYQAGLFLEFSDGRAFCGGTLISKRCIVTAAHCADGVENITAILGAIDILNEAEKGQQRIPIAKKNIFVHEQWDPKTLSNDISLINLPIDIEFNERIQPATLPKKINGQYSTYNRKKVLASGWGKDSDSATSISPTLRYIEAKILDRLSCNAYYFGSITDKMICINGITHKSTCNGDSGGPLVYKDGTDNTLIGATSFGISFGCDKGWPSVFTRITAYVDWLNDKCGK